MKSYTWGSEADPRPPRAVSRTTAWWGMLMAIAVLSSMLSTLVFAAVYLRAGADRWPPDGASPPPLGVPLMATALLVASSVAAIRVQAVARRGGRRGQLQVALVVAFLFGGAFLASQLIAELALGLNWEADVHDSVFLVTAAFHHVGALVGMAAFVFVVVHLRTAVLTPRQQILAVNAALFWHYVAGGWVVVFAVLYVMPRVW